jgi:hypothetical protein
MGLDLLVTVFSGVGMAVTAAGRLFVAEFAIGRAITVWTSVFVAVVTLFAKFDHSVSAFGWVGITAVVDQGAILGTVGAGSSVEITVIALFWKLE